MAQPTKESVLNSFSEKGKHKTHVNLLSTIPGHTDGRMGSGRTGCQETCSPVKHSCFATFGKSKTRHVNFVSEACTGEILFKQLQNEAFGGIWFISGTRRLSVPCCCPMEPRFGFFL